QIGSIQDARHYSGLFNDGARGLDIGFSDDESTTSAGGINSDLRGSHGDGFFHSRISLCSPRWSPSRTAPFSPGTTHSTGEISALALVTVNSRRRISSRHLKRVQKRNSWASSPLSSGASQLIKTCRKSRRTAHLRGFNVRGTKAVYASPQAAGLAYAQRFPLVSACLKH